MRNIKSIVKALLLGSVLCSCEKDIESHYSAIQANRLLSADVEKEWLRTARTEDGQAIDVEECQDRNTLVFLIGKSKTVDSLYVQHRASICSDGQKPSIVYKARYSLAEDIHGQFEDEIVIEKEELLDINRIAVRNLTADYMTLAYTVDGVEIVEEYSFE
ncbi:MULTISPECIES: hypothetical protein [Reichenbachiella]|uniref:hypothetical protein n=1 Tax=Reichenbachiella TaxID=156993 RepID=UPI0011C46CAA|nr:MULTISPECIES: hypothetical protein [Reichenbachiella]MBU2913988.1 hypothetical protein [Reichenbachiella agariperforans]